MPRIFTRRKILSCTTCAAAVAGGLAFFFRPPIARAVDFQTIEAGGRHYTIARVDLKKEKLELFHHDESGQPFQRLRRIDSWLNGRGRKLAFGMNAGMFHPGFVPVGLYVADGKTVSALNTEDGKGNFFLKPNGVFAITGKGARIVETSQFPKITDAVTLATQSGPMLVLAGKLHSAFNAGSVSRLIRNGVGAVSPHQVVFAISEDPVNFHEFATFFRDSLKCPDALFLDGTISSLFAPSLKRDDHAHNLGPMIGVTESAAP